MFNQFLVLSDNIREVSSGTPLRRFFQKWDFLEEIMRVASPPPVVFAGFQRKMVF